MEFAWYRYENAVFWFWEDTHWGAADNGSTKGTESETAWDAPYIGLHASWFTIFEASVECNVNCLMLARLLGVEILYKGRVRVEIRSCRVPISQTIPMA